MRSFLPVLLLLLPACPLCEQLTANRVVLGTVLHVPELVDPTQQPPAVQPERTEAAVFVGELVEGTSKPAPISGAKVRLIHPMAPEGIELVEDPEEPGNYERSGEDEPGLVYLEHQEYRVEVEEGGDTYVMRVTLPEDEAERIELDPSLVTAHERNTELLLAHPEPGELAFVTVARGPNPTTGCAAPAKKKVYTTVPKKGSQVRDLIDNDGRWRADPIVVPAEAFESCGLYSVVLSVAAKGEPVTNNLFIGSQLFAGWAGGTLYRVP